MPRAAGCHRVVQPGSQEAGERPVSMMSSNERGRKENGAVMKQRQLAVSVVQVRVASKRRPLVLKVSHCCPPNNPGLLDDGSYLALSRRVRGC